MFFELRNKLIHVPMHAWIPDCWLILFLMATASVRGLTSHSCNESQAFSRLFAHPSRWPKIDPMHTYEQTAFFLSGSSGNTNQTRPENPHHWICSQHWWPFGSLHGFQPRVGLWNHLPLHDDSVLEKFSLVQTSDHAKKCGTDSVGNWDNTGSNYFANPDRFVAEANSGDLRRPFAVDAQWRRLQWVSTTKDVSSKELFTRVQK
jgi:hypothetical protein